MQYKANGFHDDLVIQTNKCFNQLIMHFRTHIIL